MNAPAVAARAAVARIWRRVRCLPDGRWFDERAQTWRDRRGRPARWPDLIDAGHFHLTRVVLAAAHLDNNPANNRLTNLRKGLVRPGATYPPIRATTLAAVELTPDDVGDISALPSGRRGCAT